MIFIVILLQDYSGQPGMPWIGQKGDSEIVSALNEEYPLLLMTQCKMEVRILSGGVTKNLTLHGMSKIDFQPDFRNGLMLSFLLMYNTMGSKVNGLAVREHFL